MVGFNILVVLLCCSACGLAQNTSCQLAAVCVASEEGTEGGCQRPNVTYRVIRQLSDFPQEAKNCTSVHIYLTSGTHILRVNLDFTDSVEETQIHGAPNGQATIVSCSNKAGIRFSEKPLNKIFLSNLIFTHCERICEIGFIIKSIPAALCFQDAIWTLDNVAVKNTQGYGLYAKCCTQQLIHNSTFDNNTQGHVKIALNNRCNVNSDDYVIKIEDSTFTRAVHSYGVVVEARDTVRRLNFCNVTLRNSRFSNNKNGVIYTTDINSIEITDCLITHNNGTGIFIWMFSDSRFTQVKICRCIFSYNRVYQSVVSIKGYYTARSPQDLYTLQKCLFARNYGAHQQCSALDVIQASLTLNDVTIRDNNCTGINNRGGKLKIKNHLNLTTNHGKLGGGLTLGEILTPVIYSRLIFTISSQVNIVNNTADTYGGGILLREDGLNRNCFFQFDDQFDLSTPVFKFSGNRASLGGDAVFRGSLSNCDVLINKTRTLINKTDQNNIFWDLVSSENIQSQSTFVDVPERVLFCTNVTSAHPEIHCKASHTVNAFRGERFNVSLMVADGYCSPSVRLVKVKLNGNAAKVKLERGELFLKSMKYCSNFTYAITGGLEQNTTTIEFDFQEQLYIPLNMPPAVLTVNLIDCPLGFKLSSKGRCDCNAALETHNIQCHSDTHTLEIPAQTWVGEIRGNVIVQKECQYCRTEGKQIIRDIARDSSKLCTAHRTGIMCGACSPGYSLQLGGHECADCSNSTHKGVILVIAFLIIGAVLVLLLMRLDLTVSTGTINGLVFYSNIVYLNSNTLLPISREGNSSHLQNVVQVLYTFQAWMNLDFGIATCFFDGYDTYISTWMQFVFPLYIWLLILIIVLASRYSTRIAKLTTSNTVSVLATLLLLSYAKLLNTSIEAFSSIKLFSLDGVSMATVWKQDGNIFYHGRTHVWLFLMSLVMIVFYILPFTLLIVLGPKLLVNKWINKMKPFLDAFYGPYTRRYRYWPGMLLLLRLAVLCTFAFLSPNDGPFRLMTVSLMVIVLFITWMVIGEPQKLHRKRHLNYLELFFHSNLGILASVSIYLTQSTNDKVRNQQALAVAMVGSALMVFCGILVYQVFSIACIRRAMPKLDNVIPTRIRDLAGRKKEPKGCPQEIQVHDHATTTHSRLELTPNNELRERLLTDS